MWFYTADYKGFQKFNMPLLIGEKYPKGFIILFTALAFRLKRERLKMFSKKWDLGQWDWWWFIWNKENLRDGVVNMAIRELRLSSETRELKTEYLLIFIAQLVILMG